MELHHTVTQVAQQPHNVHRRLGYHRYVEVVHNLQIVRQIAENKHQVTWTTNKYVNQHAQIQPLKIQHRCYAQ